MSAPSCLYKLYPFLYVYKTGYIIKIYRNTSNLYG